MVVLQTLIGYFSMLPDLMTEGTAHELFILHGWMYGSSADLSYFSMLPDFMTEGTAHELFP